MAPTQGRRRGRLSVRETGVIAGEGLPLAESPARASRSPSSHNGCEVLELDAVACHHLMVKDPRCLLGLHRWQRKHYADGGTYLQCWRCGKEHERKPDGGFIYT